ncbi:MAG: zinc-ribbon domain-containing protein [Clostridia bacterium]
MFCGSCGKENPQGASFCAFCGSVLAAAPPVIDAEMTENPAEIPEDKPENPAYAAYKRPDPALQVKPLAENPAQPVRPASEAAEPPAPQAVRREAPARPPRENAQKRQGVVDGTGRVQRPPERKAPVVPPRKDAYTEQDTIIPRKKRRRADDDMFFEDIDLPDENPYEEDDEDDENRVARYIKSGVAALVLLLVMGVLFWLWLLPSGQTFRASMGFGAPAGAYALLGDQYMNEGSLKRAADAYYTALRLDPASYDYSLMVARTQSQLGDQDRALAAYAKCISLKPDQPDPYREVGEIYQQNSEPDLALNAYKTGYDKTGDLDLFKKYQDLNGQPAAQ